MKEVLLSLIFIWVMIISYDMHNAVIELKKQNDLIEVQNLILRGK